MSLPKRERIAECLKALGASHVLEGVEARGGVGSGGPWPAQVGPADPVQIAEDLQALNAMVFDASATPYDDFIARIGGTVYATPLMAAECEAVTGEKVVWLHGDPYQVAAAESYVDMRRILADIEAVRLRYSVDPVYVPLQPPHEVLSERTWHQEYLGDFPVAEPAPEELSYASLTKVARRELKPPFHPPETFRPRPFMSFTRDDADVPQARVLAALDAALDSLARPVPLSVTVTIDLPGTMLPVCVGVDHASGPDTSAEMAVTVGGDETERCRNV